MYEVAKNIFLEGSVISDQLPDSQSWLKTREDMPVRYVGGIHNINKHDKKRWVEDQREPLRIVETGTGREEVWFTEDWKTPVYVSLDVNSNITSHMKFNRIMPSVVQLLMQKNPVNSENNSVSKFNFWHQDNVLHRPPDTEGPGSQPAVTSEKVFFPVHSEYIAGIVFFSVEEHWIDGEWQQTEIDKMSFIFTKPTLNKVQHQCRAIEWIGKHCRGGFFPLADEPFADAEEEFMFLADICSKG
jgi:hypothetical protein